MDLVEELRVKAHMTEGGLDVRVYCLHYRDALKRAADEIEKLRAELARRPLPYI